MNNAQAFAKLRKLLGPKACYRTSDSAPDADERVELQAKIDPLREARAAAEAAMKARRAELLSDPEYRRLCDEYARVRKEHEETCSRARWYRFTVGRSNNIFFEVTAEGDSWTDVFAKLEAKGIKS